MERQYLVIVVLVMLLADVAAPAFAGTLSPPGSPATSVTVPFGPFTPNNDDAGPFPANVAKWNIPFTAALTPIELQLHVNDSGGTTEYRVQNTLFVPPEVDSIPWSAFRLELVGPQGLTGLDFDSGANDTLPHIRALFGSPSSVTLTTMEWLNPPPQQTYNLFFEIDVPDMAGDAPYDFTLRYVPVVVVPEPGTMGVLMMVGVLSLSLRARRRSLGDLVIW